MKIKKTRQRESLRGRRDGISMICANPNMHFQQSKHKLRLMFFYGRRNELQREQVRLTFQSSDNVISRNKITQK